MGVTSIIFQSVFLRICLILMLAWQPYQIIAQSIVINEVMASNATTIADEDGDYEDWIELYNFGPEPVDLLNYALSDDYEHPMKWVFPSIAMQPGEFLLIWASGKDRKTAGHALHTNFSINAAGEEIILTSSDSLTLDEIPPVMASTDIAYGRIPDGNGQWLYLTSATPGEPNTGPGYAFLLDPVEFSESGGAYNEAFLLNLSHPAEGAQIVYTLDGSLPAELDSVYSEPILVRNRTGDPNDISMIPTNNNPDPGPPYFEGWQPPLGQVFKVNVVRARAIHPGAPPGPVTTHTYLVHQNASERYSLPWFSMTSDRENLFDDDIGIYVHGNHTNYFQDGPDWERPANLTLFENDGSLAFNEDIGIRLHGNTTRSRPRKSLRINARAEYGSSWINYQLFPDKPINQYKRFILRNSGNDWDMSVFRDAFMQQLAKDLHVDIQYYALQFLFVNGEYWGIHNIRDRYNHHHIAFALWDRRE
jgi:hypothetical protein